MGRCLRLTSRSETPSVDLSYLHRWTFPLSLSLSLGFSLRKRRRRETVLWCSPLIPFPRMSKMTTTVHGFEFAISKESSKCWTVASFFHSTRPCFEIIHRLKRLHLTGSFDFQADEWIKLDERGDYRIYGFIFLRLPFLWKCMEFREWNWVTEILMTSKRDRLIYYPFIVYTHVTTLSDFQILSFIH